MFDLPPPTQCQLAALNFNVNVFRVKVLEKTDQIDQIASSHLDVNFNRKLSVAELHGGRLSRRKIIIMSLMISKVAIDLYPT